MKGIPLKIYELHFESLYHKFHEENDVPISYIFHMLEHLTEHDCSYTLVKNFKFLVTK